MEMNNEITALYDEQGEKIYRFIYYKTFHRETAEDLTSQTFLKALEKWSQFDRARGQAVSWLYGIARNLVTDHYRTGRKWGIMSDVNDAWDLPSRDDVLTELTDSETREELRTALGKLPASQREVVILRLWEDMPYGEIAPILKRSEGSCKMLFSRAIKSLRTSLGSALLYQFLMLEIPTERRK